MSHESQDRDWWVNRKPEATVFLEARPGIVKVVVCDLTVGPLEKSSRLRFAVKTTGAFEGKQSPPALTPSRGLLSILVGGNLDSTAAVWTV